MKFLLRILVALLFFSVFSLAQDETEPPAASACHLFIDEDFIWTLEMVSGPGSPIPILNIITFREGQWDLRPDQILLLDSRNRAAEVERFSIDTGVEGEPYKIQYLKVQGDSFIGMDLEGDFEGFEEPATVSIDLEGTRFRLQPIDCLAFENAAEKINQVNFDSPDVSQDFAVLGIEPMGQRGPRPRR